jgi:Biotin carboxylase
VLFVSDEQWNCFNQLAAVLRRHGIRPVRVLTERNGRRGLLTRLMDCLVYAGVVDLGRPSGVADLRRLVATGQVLDLQIDERSFQSIDPGSVAARELARLDGSRWHTRAAVYDKVALAERLHAHGIPLAPLISADEVSPEEAIGQFGLPIVVKCRWGTGGTEVRIAADVSELVAAVASLGGDRSQIFYQRHIDGDLVGYGAVVRNGSPIQEFAALELKSVADPLGPTAHARATGDARVLTAGREVLGVLGTEGFFSAEFMQARDGSLFFIDVSTRVWGNFLCWTAVGLDLTEGYLHAIGVVSTPPAVTGPQDDGLVTVFPAALSDVFRSDAWTTAVRATWRDARSYLPHVGVTYCTLAAVALVVDRLRRSRTPRATKDPEVRLH